MHALFNKIKLQVDDVIKIALGPKEATNYDFSTWERILSDIIVGDAFGADRIDYLLRDSLHTGVAYGRFDHYRLIDTLRILPLPPSDKTDSPDIALGVDFGGIQSAEALMLARYFMFSQVYFHPVRLIYDIHLKDFLKAWLPGSRFGTDPVQHLKMTDSKVMAGLLEAAENSKHVTHTLAGRIAHRKHYKVLYERNPVDVTMNPDPGSVIYQKAIEQFGHDNVRRANFTQKGGAPDFPVQMRDGSIASSLTLSRVLSNLPMLSLDYVFVNPEKRTQALKWLATNRDPLLRAQTKEAST